MKAYGENSECYHSCLLRNHHSCLLRNSHITTPRSTICRWVHPCIVNNSRQPERQPQGNQPVRRMENIQRIVGTCSKTALRFRTPGVCPPLKKDIKKLIQHVEDIIVNKSTALLLTHKNNDSVGGDEQINYQAWQVAVGY